jgi:hypothetical protein
MPYLFGRFSNFYQPATVRMPAKSGLRLRQSPNRLRIRDSTTPNIAIQIQNRIIPIRTTRSTIRAIIPIAARNEASPLHSNRQIFKNLKILIQSY